MSIFVQFSQRVNITDDLKLQVLCMNYSLNHAKVLIAPDNMKFRIPDQVENV